MENCIKKFDTSQIKEENITYFYSKFDLFDESLNFYFLKYQIYKKALETALGTDWQEYAKITIKKENNYMETKQIFNNLLEIWLELRKEFNYIPTTYNNSSNIDIEDLEKEELNEKEFDDSEFYSQFELRFFDKIRKDNYEIEFNCCKALIQGFFQSAKKVWKEIIEGKDDGYLEFYEPKNEKNNYYMPGLGYLKSTLKTTFNHSKNMMLKPLVIAKEKIFDYFSVKNKKGKNNSEEKIEFPKPKENLMKTEDEAKNFSNFHRNVQIEASEDIKMRFEALSLQESTESSVSEQELSKKRKFNELNTPPKPQKFIKIKKLTKKAEKNIDPYFLNLAAKKIGSFVQDTQKKWQVARGFVTSSIEVNYNRLANLENNIVENLKNTVKIRFLQPTKEFYHHLMKVFLIFKTNNNYTEISFSQYLEKVKISMGNFWNEKYIKPTEVFFATILQEWSKMKIEGQNEEVFILFKFKRHFDYLSKELEKVCL